MESKVAICLWLIAISTSHASFSIHEWWEVLTTAFWMILMSHKWKFKAPCMQYVRVMYDSMIFRFEECMSPLGLIQNFGMSYTLFMAVELFSVNCRTHCKTHGV